MFWRVATFQQISPVEVILDRDDCSLEQLLDEDEIIQECKSANTRLVNYLNKRETIATLISYLSEPPDNDADFRYSFTACEIFCCELDELFTTLMEDEALMASLFSLLDKPPPLNSALVGYFGRVVGSLLTKRPDRMHDYLQAHSDLLPKLVTHIDTTSIVEVVLRLVGADEVTSTMAASDTLSDWLASTDFMQLLLERLCRPMGEMGRSARRLQKAAQRNVASILVAIAATQPSPLAEQLTQRQYLRTMLHRAADPPSDLLSPVLQVCIALLEPNRPLPSLTQAWSALMPGPLPDAQGMDEQAEAESALLRAAAQEIVDFLPAFTALLDVPDEDADQEQPYGTLKPRLGRRRLTVIEFGKALLASGMPLTVTAIMASAFVPKAMQLFQDFPFNNILHNYVYQIFESLLDTLQPRDPEGGAASPHSTAHSPLPDVVDFLVDECKLLEWIVTLGSWEYVRPSSKTFQIKNANKLTKVAYQGHVTDLANKVLDVARASNNGALISALQLSGEWQDYEVNRLAVRTKVQDVNAWNVGRPPTLDHTISSQDDDEDGTLRPLVHFMGKQDEDENPMALEQYSGNTFMPDCSQQRYANDIDEDDDAASDGSANSGDDAGPESHQIEDDDGDSDSSDSGQAGMFPAEVADLQEAQTIEDEDVVELGDEAAADDKASESDVSQTTAAAFDALAISAGEVPTSPSGVSALDGPAAGSHPVQGASGTVGASAAGGAGEDAPEGAEGAQFGNFWKLPLTELTDAELTETT